LRQAVWPGLGAKAPLKSEPVRIRSLAVLPFANLSADKENEYFSDGLAEEIINGLTIDRGFDWLEKTVDEHDGMFLHLHVDPIYDSLRSHPRYQILLRKMNLKP